MRRQLEEAQKSIVMTDEFVLLQEIGIYQYRHPLTDVVAYQGALADIEDKRKSWPKRMAVLSLRDRLDGQGNITPMHFPLLLQKVTMPELERLRGQLVEINEAIESVDFRAANVRAGYVYVISNIGSFGQRMVKIGMTRRLEPMDRIRELSDASVPFNFDVHALFFSNDAGQAFEMEMHQRLLKCFDVNTATNDASFFTQRPLKLKF